MSQNLLPTSPAGAMATEFLQVFNSADKTVQERFLETRLSTRAKKEKPVTEYLSVVEKAYRQSGGVEVVRVERAEPNPFVFHVKAKHGDHLAKIFFFVDKTEPNKIGFFGFIPLVDPLATEDIPKQGDRLNDIDAKTEIEKRVLLAGEKDLFSGVVLVACDNKPLVELAVGQAQKSFEVPNRVDTKFNLGSMNKMFTALSIAQLVETGKLTLSDKLVDVLPNYPGKESAEKIAVHHLLSHSAGLGGLFERPEYDRTRKYLSNSDYLPIFANEPLLYEPGTKGVYSNEGYIVLGAMIEEVSGEDYHDYVRHHIFDPAGMNDTGPFALDETTPNLAVGYMRYDDDPFGVEPRHPNHMFLGWRGNACGGGYSTAPDLLRFATALKSYRFASKHLTDEFTRPQGHMKSYGLGFEVEDYKGKKVVGHTGGGPNSGVNSALKIFWDQPYSVIVLGNYDAPVAQDMASAIARFLA
ncbi:beta-lactamase family protein [Candidatus Bathyarchaeota archaeon]|nr:beta-lactamase family protein [Candidatus Bathyarchaeota archaeon]